MPDSCPKKIRKSARKQPPRPKSQKINIKSAGVAWVNNRTSQAMLVMLISFVATASFLGAEVSAGQAQTANPPPADHPEVTVRGRKYTPQSILARNMGTPED